MSASYREGSLWWPAKPRKARRSSGSTIISDWPVIPLSGDLDPSLRASARLRWDFILEPGRSEASVDSGRRAPYRGAEGPHIDQASQ